MNEYLSPWMQSTLAIGGKLLPYVGIAILIILFIALIALFGYVLWRLSRRLPPMFRYLFWKIGILLRKIGALRNQRVNASSRLMARVTDAGNLVPLESPFKVSRWQKLTQRTKTPQLPLWLVVGTQDVSCNALMRKAALGPNALPEIASEQASSDLTWWPLQDRLALQIPVQMLQESAKLDLVSLQKALVHLSTRAVLNGVVVVVSAQELLQPILDNKKLSDIFRSIEFFSNALGLCLPVHLVIENMQDLPGYVDVAKLSKDDEDFQRHWVWMNPALSVGDGIDPSIKSWLEGLKSNGLAAIVKRGPIANFGDLNSSIALLNSLPSLHPQLSLLANRCAMAVGKNDAPMFLSGIYFSGSDHTQPWVRELQFAQQTPYSTTKLVSVSRYMGLLTLVFGCALFLNWWTSRTVAKIGADVQVIEMALQRNQSSVLDEFKSSTTDVQRQAIDIFDAVNAISLVPLHYFLSPSSWFGSEQQRAYVLLGRALQKSVVNPRLEELVSLSGKMIPKQGETIVNVQANQIENLPTYSMLQNLLQISEMTYRFREAIHSASNRLTYEDFYNFLGYKSWKSQKINWDWKGMLPQPVTEQLDVSKLQDGESRLNKQLIDYWNSILVEAIDTHPVVVTAQELVTMVNQLARTQSISYSDASKLAGLLQRLSREVEMPNAKRILGSQAEALEFFNRAFLSMGRSPEISISQTVEITSQVNQRRDNVRKNLQSMDLTGIGGLFVTDPNGVMALSPEIKRFALVFNGMMAQRFMQPVSSEQQLAQRMPLSDVRWNTSQLEMLKSVTAAFRDFSETGLSAIDSALRPGISRLVQSHVRLVVDDVFWQAATSEPLSHDSKSNPEAVIKLVQSQTAALLQVIAAYRQNVPEDLQNRETQKWLVNQVQQQLGKFDLLFKKEDPYLAIVGKIDAWLVQPVSTRRPLASFFRSSVQEYLASTRSHMVSQYLAHVNPLLDAWLLWGHLVDATEGTQFWQRLSRAVEAYNKNTGVNGLSEFEGYVLGLSKLGGQDECRRFMNERDPSARRGDYFFNNLALLENLLAEKCDSQIEMSRYMRYHELARWFNDQLAGRMPFGSHSGKSPLTQESFVQAMTRYREQRSALGDLGMWPQVVTDFLLKMDNVAALLAPQRETASDAKSAAGKRSVNATFRANVNLRLASTKAVLSEHIVDVEMVVGNQQYGLRNVNEPFQWHVGDPIELRLRWAINSPYRPVVNDDDVKKYKVVNRSAIFSFGGDWSLMELVRLHRATENRKKIVLQFPVVVMGISGKERAQYFMELEPLDDQGNMGLDFPVQAPVISKAMMRVNSGKGHRK